MPFDTATLKNYYEENKPRAGDPLADNMGGDASRVHDWRNYVGVLEAFWPTLSAETRMAVALVAEMQASSEDWD